MDLDKIKDTWKSAELPLSTINEQTIQHIIETRGQTALDKLIRHEKFFLNISALCALFLPMFWIIHPYLFIFYLITLIIGFLWQRYKLRLLRNIDLQNMGIIDVSSRIVKYKDSLIRELVIGLIWFIIFFSLFLFLQVQQKTTLGENLSIGDISATIIVIITYIISITAVILIFYKIYWKNIKSIQKAIEEIKSFKSEER